MLQLLLMFFCFHLFSAKQEDGTSTSPKKQLTINTCMKNNTTTHEVDGKENDALDMNESSEPKLPFNHG